MTKATPAVIFAAPPAKTPENTPVPGGGSWRWDYTQQAWAANTSDQPLQTGDTGALQTFESTQE
jgi:hypothetical protein